MELNDKLINTYSIIYNNFFLIYYILIECSRLKDMKRTSKRQYIPHVNRTSYM